MAIPVPCKDCSSRTVECHGSCRKYREYKRQKQAEAEMVRMGKMIDEACLDSKARWRGARMKCPRKGKK